MVTAIVACPTDQEIAAFVDGATSPGDRASVARHVDGCVRCFELVASLARLRDNALPEVDTPLREAVVRAPVQSRWITQRLPAVAAAAAVVLAVVWWRLPEPSAPVPVPSAASVPSSPAEPTRAAGGSAVTVEQPKDGDVLGGHPEVRWNGPGETVTYEVLVTSAAGDVLWQRRVPGSVHNVELGAALPAGQPCYLWVAAYLPEGRRLTSNVIKVRAAGL
jgi:hypothetical protein